MVAAVAAAMLSGCGSTQTRRCVDDRGNVIPDQNCVNSTYGSPYYGRSRWGYGGSYSGGVLRNFSSTPSSGANIQDSTGHSISRGGFGGSGGSFGG